MSEFFSPVPKKYLQGTLSRIKTRQNYTSHVHCGQFLQGSSEKSVSIASEEKNPCATMQFSVELRIQLAVVSLTLKPRCHKEHRQVSEDMFPADMVYSAQSSRVSE